MTLKKNFKVTKLESFLAENFPESSFLKIMLDIICIGSVTKASIKKGCMQKFETSILKKPKQQLLRKQFQSSESGICPKEKSKLQILLHF